MTPKVLVPVADGTEELEAISIIDILRRAGAEVIIASVDGPQITASRGTRILADRLIGDCLNDEYDLIALPGGLPGSEHLRDSVELKILLEKQKDSGRLYGAICAAPAVVLQHHGLLAGKRAACYPSFESHLDTPAPPSERVVVDGKVATSRGAGTALEFALKLVELLYGPEKSREVAESIVAA